MLETGIIALLIVTGYGGGLFLSWLKNGGSELWKLLRDSM